MSSLYIKGAEIITPLQVFKADVYIEGDSISKISDSKSASRSRQVVDGRGCYLTPGLVDLQVNGSKNCNLWREPTTGQFGRLRRELLRAGVTSFLPTLITDDLQHLRKNIAFLADSGVAACRAELMSARVSRKVIDSSVSKTALARVPGIHLEGPFLSQQKPGVHPQKWLRAPSVSAVKKILTPEVKLMTVAPELAGARGVIRFLLQHGVTVSLGHSNATFEQAQRAFDAGVTLMTHTYNALPAFHHRAPGAVAAAMLNPAVACTIIADGLHVHPAAIKILLKCKNVSRTILVSDAAWEGTRHGELVGSSITVADAVANLVRWKITSFAEAILMATYNPAAAIGLEKKIGHIAPGAKADMLLWDKKTLKLKSVIFDGQIFKK